MVTHHPLHPSTSCALHLAKRGANRHPPFILPVSTQSVTFCCTYRFPHFLAEKSIDVLPPACAHNSAPRPRAFARGSCIFLPTGKSAPLRGRLADYLSPISAQTTTALWLLFCPYTPRIDRGNSQKCMGVVGKVQHPQYAHF